MNLSPSAVEQAIAMCDRITANIEAIQRDLRASTEALDKTIKETIEKCNAAGVKVNNAQP